MNESLHYASRQVTGEYQEDGENAGIGHMLFQGNRGLRAIYDRWYRRVYQSSHVEAVDANIWSPEAIRRFILNAVPDRDEMPSNKVGGLQKALAAIRRNGEVPDVMIERVSHVLQNDPDLQLMYMNYWDGINSHIEVETDDRAVSAFIHFLRLDMPGGDGKKIGFTDFPKAMKGGKPVEHATNLEPEITPAIMRSLLEGSCAMGPYFRRFLQLEMWSKGRELALRDAGIHTVDVTQRRSDKHYRIKYDDALVDLQPASLHPFDLVADTLWNARTEKGIMQVEAADNNVCTPQALRFYERGQHRPNALATKTLLTRYGRMDLLENQLFMEALTGYKKAEHPFGFAMAHRRFLKGITKVRLAEMLGVDDSTVRRWELQTRNAMGGRKSPSPEFLQLCKLLDWPPQEAISLLNERLNKFWDERIKAHAEGHELPHARGYIADMLSGALANTNLSAVELAKEAKLYPAFLQAYCDGLIVPDAAILDQLEHQLNPAGRQDVHDYIQELAAQDTDRMRAETTNPRLRHLKAVLSHVRTDTYPHEFIDQLFLPVQGQPILIRQDLIDADPAIRPNHIKDIRAESVAKAAAGERENLFRFESSRAIVQHIASGLSLACGDKEQKLAPLVTAYLFDRQARESFGQLFDSYMQQPNTSFRGLFDYVAAQWECPLKEACASLGMDSNGLCQANDGQYGTELLNEVADRERMTPEQKHRLTALRKATLGLGDIRSLTAQARQMLEDPEPTFNAYKDSPITTHLRNMPHDGQSIAKHLVPNALLGALLEYSGTTITRYLQLTSKTPDNGGVLQGRTHFLVVRTAGRAPHHQTQAAQKAARFFTDDPMISEQLALAFLEIGAKQSPDELFARVQSGDLSIGDMVRQLRLQHFQSRSQLGQAIMQSKKTKADLLTDVESGEKLLTNDEVAKRLADIFYKEYPGSTSKDAFKAAVCGRTFDEAQIKAVKAEQVARVEASIIEAAKSELGKARGGFRKVLPELIAQSEGMVSQWLAELSQTQAMGGESISRSSYYKWRDGSPVGETRHADAIVELAQKKGMHAKFASTLHAVARQRVAHYDPNIFGQIDDQTMQAERSRALATMRENMCITKKEMAARVGMNTEDYNTIEQAGWLHEKSRARERKAANIAAQLIPDDVPACIQTRSRLVRILCTEPPQHARTIEPKFHHNGEGTYTIKFDVHVALANESSRTTNLRRMPRYDVKTRQRRFELEEDMQRNTKPVPSR